VSHEYENTRRISYGGATFVPVCEKCGRFIKPPETIKFGHLDQPVTPYAHCSKCGPTTMPFEGYL
jgi:hypothetical protein